MTVGTIPTLTSAQQALFNLLVANESASIQNQTNYSLTVSTNDSGYSFGPVQYDLSAGNAVVASLLNTLLTDFVDGSGNHLTSSQIASIEAAATIKPGKPGALNATQIGIINAALQLSTPATGDTPAYSAAQTVNNTLPSYLDSLYATAATVATLAANAGTDPNGFLSTTLGQLFLCDFANQFGITSGGPLEQFVQGDTVTFASGRTVSIDSGLALSFGEMLQFVVRTKQDVLSPWDFFRRVANVANYAGGYTPQDTNDALSALRAYTFAYLPNKSIFTTSGRTQDLQNFITNVVAPADSTVETWLSTKYGVTPGANFNDGDIFVGDSNLLNTGLNTILAPGKPNQDYVLIAGDQPLFLLIGGSGNDILVAGAGSDTLWGGSGGNDTLVAGQGTYAFLQGSTSGTDTFEITASDGGSIGDVAIDDGYGDTTNSIIKIGGTQITGSGTTHTSADVWTDGNGLTYDFIPLASSTVGTLAILGGALGTGGEIDIKNFDLTKAENGGYLGIQLAKTAELVKGAKAVAPGTGVSGNVDPPMASGGEQTITFALDTPALQNQTVTITANSGNGSNSNYGYEYNGQFTAGNTLTLTLKAGQQEVMFTFVNTDADTSEDTVVLSASVTDANNNTIQSNTLTLDVAQGTTDTPVAAPSGGTSLAAKYAPDPDPVTGKTIAIFDGTYVSGTNPDGSPQYTSYPAGTYMNVSGISGDMNEVGLSGGNDSVDVSTGYLDSVSIGGSGNSVVTARDGDGVNFSGTGDNSVTFTGTSPDSQWSAVALGEGNDSVTGASGEHIMVAGSIYSFTDPSGNTQIGISGSGADKNNVIVGNGATMAIALGDGNNAIYANSALTVGGNNDPSQPADIGAAIQASANAQGNSTVLGDVIGVGNGNNTIFGGNKSDDIYLGTGNNDVVAGAGGSFIIGGVSASQASGLSEYYDSWYYPDNGYPFANYYVQGSIDAIDVQNEIANPVTTGGGNDTIFGGKGNDEIIASSGADYIDGGGGDDFIMGGTGSDTIVVGNASLTGDNAGSSLVYGGDGDSYIEAINGNNYLVGMQGNNTIYGGSGNDTIYAGDDGDGTTWMSKTSGNNYVYGGTGNAYIYGSDGNDTLVGGDGNDTLVAGDGNEDVEAGGNGNDILDASYSTGSVTLVGGNGSDSFWGGVGNSVIYAGDGGTADAPTEVFAGSGATTIYGGDGIDQILGGSGTDVIYAGDGGTGDTPTLVQAGSGSTTIYGGDGIDQIAGGSGTDVIYAGDGGTEDAPTLVRAGSGPTTIYGGDGTDELNTSEGSGGDEIIGGAGDTTMWGAANDTLVAGDGNDVLVSVGSTTDKFNAGFGSAEIQSGGSGVNLQFGSGIGASDIGVTAGDDGSLELDIDIGGTITIDSGQSASVGTITFGDGSTTSLAQLIQQSGVGSQEAENSAGNGTNVFSTDSGAVLASDNGNDLLSTWGGDSTLWGGSGNDTLVGGSGSDLLLGGSGDTTLIGVGNDTLQGGSGTSWFELGNGVGSGQVDVVSGSGTGNVQVSSGSTVSAVVGNDGNPALLLTNAIKGGAIRIEDAFSAGSSMLYNLPGASNLSFLQLLSDLSPATSTASDAGGDTVGFTDENNATLQTTGTGQDTLMAFGQQDDLVITAGAQGAIEANSTTDILAASNLPFVNGNIQVEQDGDTYKLFTSADDSTYMTMDAQTWLNLEKNIQDSLGSSIHANVDVANPGNGTVVSLINPVPGDAYTVDNDENNNDVLQIDNGFTLSTAPINTTINQDGSATLQVVDANGDQPVVVTVSDWDDFLSILDTTGNAAGYRIDDSSNTVDGANISGKDGNDFLIGGSADENLSGNDGNDTLDGGGGNNYLAGGVGNDTYILSSGGSNTIEDTAGNNTLQLAGTAVHIDMDATDVNLYNIAGIGADLPGSPSAAMDKNTWSTMRLVDNTGQAIPVMVDVVGDAAYHYQVDADSATGVETLTLPDGLLLSGYHAVQNGADLLLESNDPSVNTVVVLRGYFTASQTDWQLQVKDADGTQSLQGWVESQLGDSINPAATSALQYFNTEQLLEFENAGSQGNSVQSSSENANNGYYYGGSLSSYTFVGVNQQNDSIGTSIYITDHSEEDQLQYNYRTYQAYVPIYKEKNVPGYTYTVPGIDYNSGNNTISQQVITYTVPAQHEEVQVGRQLETFSEVNSVNVTRTLILQHISGGDGDHAVMAFLNSFNPFYGTVSIGNGNNYVDLGGGEGEFFGTPTDIEGAFIQAGNGDNVLIGTGANDVFVSGDGTNILEGGSGSDTYYVSMANHATTLISDRTWLGFSSNANYTDVNTVVLPEGVAAANLSYRWLYGATINGSNGHSSNVPILQLNYGDANLFIAIGRDGSGDYGVQKFQFADGSVLTLSQLVGNGANGSTAGAAQPLVDGVANVEVESLFNSNTATYAWDSNGNLQQQISYTDVEGNTKTDSYENGALVSDSWTHVDGSYGSDVFNTDGTLQSNTATDAFGNTIFFSLDAQGTGQYVYSYANGLLRTDSYFRNMVMGSSLQVSDSLGGSTTDISGNTINFALDAGGNGTILYNDVNGDTQTYTYVASVMTNDSWTKEDGSSGSDTYSTYGDSGAIVDHYVEGVLTSDNWIDGNGGYGIDVFHADGTSNGSRTDSMGSTVTYSQDAEGNRIITGGTGDEILSGGSGNDLLVGGNGNDTFIGGGGNDALVGGSGTNTFMFAEGDGNDTIEGSNSSDVISLAASISPEDVFITNDGSGGYQINYLDSSSSIDVQGGGVDTIDFNDGSGTSWNINPAVSLYQDNIKTISIAASMSSGTGDAYVLWDSSQLLEDSNLSAADGWQVVGARPEGGLDNGGLFYAGEFYGYQVVAFSFEDAGSGTLQYFVQQDGQGPIYAQTANVNFVDPSADGTVYLEGTSGDDLLDSGDAANSVIESNGGNDQITTDYGNATILHQIGDGNDTINSRVGGGTPDQLILMGNSTTSLAASDITFVQDGYDLVIHENVGGVSETITDQLYFHPFFSSAAIGSVKVFANEASYEAWLADPTDNSANLLQEWTPDGTGDDTTNALRNNITQLSTAQGNETINSFNWDGNPYDWMGYYYNYVDGSAGNDSINTGDFNDTLVAGANDTLAGGSGSDTYVYNAGDGNVLIQNYATNAASTDSDTLKLGGLSGYGDVWFTRGDDNGSTDASGQDLVIHFIGDSGDQVVIQGWYNNAESQLGTISINDGATTYTLASGQTSDNSAFDALVDAMTAVGSIPGSAGDVPADISSAEDALWESGKFAVNSYDTNGVLTGDTWTNAGDGTSGTDTYNSDGSSSGTETFADGSTLAYTNDGTGQVQDVYTYTNGNTLTDNYDYYGSNLAGGLASDIWTNADGSHGLDSFNPDGSSSGTSVAADGTITAYADDANGDTHFLTANNSNASLVAGTNGVDTLDFARGSGAVTVAENIWAGGQDVVQYAGDIASNQLWFQQSGNDLLVSIIGTGDSEDFSNWYSGTSNQVGEFAAGDGKVLLASQVDNLVSAMAAFSPPSMGQTTLPNDEPQAVLTAIAANWG